MSDTPKALPDLSEMFDLNRHKAVAAFVDRFENLLRDQQALSEDLKQVAGDAKEAAFTPVEVKAMRDLARWRVNDQFISAAHKLAALRRVSNAIKADLFTWADQHRQDDAA